MAVTAMLFAACSSEDSLNLVNDEATYLKTGSNEEYIVELWNYNETWDIPPEIRAAFDGCELPQLTSSMYLGEYWDTYWGVREEAYIWMDVWITVEMKPKEFLQFESNGYATHLKEAHYVSATLHTEYYGCNFEDDENAKREFAEEYALIGTSKSEPINLNIKDCTCWKRSYNVNKWGEGESTYDADYGLQNSTYVLSVFMNGKESLQLTQHYPDVENRNLGTYYLTEEKPKNLPLSRY